MTEITTAVAKLPTEESVVGTLVAVLRDEGFGTGPLAELRRMDPGALADASPALHRLLARHVPDDLLGGEASIRRWSLLVHLLALAAPSPRAGIPKLGEALFAAEYSEGRLTKLLEARPDDFPVVLPRMVRFLVAKRSQPDPYQLARLVLHAGAESDRLAIARAYYRAEAKASP